MRHLSQIHFTAGSHRLMYAFAQGCGLPLVKGETHSTGLSRAQILVGHARVALIVLAAVIDYNLYQSEARREDIEYVTGMFTLFRQASATIGCQAGGR